MLSATAASSLVEGGGQARRAFKKREMVDFILDVVLTLEHESDFDKELVKRVLGAELKEKFPLTRYYIPRNW